MNNDPKIKTLDIQSPTSSPESELKNKITCTIKDIYKQLIEIEHQMFKLEESLFKVNNSMERIKYSHKEFSVKRKDLVELLRKDANEAP